MQIVKVIDGVLLLCGYVADDSSKLVLDSLQLRLSNVTLSVISLSNTVMSQPATVTVGGSGVLDNFCPIQKKQTFNLSGFRKRS